MDSDTKQAVLSMLRIRARRILEVDSVEVAELAVADMIGIFKNNGVDVMRSYGPPDDQESRYGDSVNRLGAKW